jgi:hypothetical protein
VNADVAKRFFIEPKVAEVYPELNAPYVSTKFSGPDEEAAYLNEAVWGMTPDAKRDFITYATPRFETPRFETAFGPLIGLPEADVRDRVMQMITENRVLVNELVIGMPLEERRTLGHQYDQLLTQEAVQGYPDVEMQNLLENVVRELSKAAMKQ